MVALDVDGMKHALPDWERDPIESGIRAREQALDAAEVHLRAGRDVVLGQYLARTPFIEALEQLANRCGARFAEFVLDVGVADLAARLRGRAVAPDRPEPERPTVRGVTTVPSRGARVIVRRRLTDHGDVAVSAHA